MSIVFAGPEIGCFTANDSASYESTSGTRYDSAYARCSMFSDGNSSAKVSPVFASTTEGYINVGWYRSNTSGASVLRTYTSGGVAAFRLYYDEPDIKIQYWNGSAWVDATGTATVASAVLQLQTIAFKVNNASGYLRLYSGTGSLLLDSGTLNLASIANIAQLDLPGAFSSADQDHCEIVVSDVNTNIIGCRLGTLYINGAGATNGMTSGDYTSVDETTYSLADFLSSAAADQVFVGACNDFDPGAGTILALGVGALARNDGGGGPQNLQLAVRTGGTTYFSSTKSLGVGYSANVAIWETNPNTGVAWVAADMAAVQIGVKSIT